ncbi:MAG TPA: ABC transporter permease [Thermoanaerobaculia bacterium]|nr:ABC transporter permease [Thermoanaerobaculia bacterium]
MNSFLRDLRLAIRGLCARPGLAATAIVVLALGIGATSGIFTLIDTLLFAPLPGLRDPASLVQVGRTDDGEGFDTFSHPWFRTLRQRTSLLAEVAAHATFDVTVQGGDGAERVTLALASGSYFPALGTPFVAGRPLLPADDAATATPVAVLGEKLAATLFGSARAAVGESVEVGGQPLAVVGVAGGGFRGIDTFDRVQLWAPLSLQPVLLPLGVDLLESHGSVWLELFARLERGASLEAAEAEAQAVAATLAAAHPDAYGGKGVRLARGLGLGPQSRAEAARFGGILFAVVALVLLIACANVTSLLLVRGAERGREIGVRMALGGSRRRLVRQLLTEALLLAVLGGGVALLLSFWSSSVLRLVVAATPAGPAAAENLDLAPNGRMVLFALGLVVGATLLTGIAPALLSTRAALAAALRQGRGPAAAAGSRSRDLVVVGQLALSLVLLVASGLYLRSLGQYLRVDPGFDAARVAAATVELDTRRSPEEAAAAWQRLLEGVGAIPEVEAAALGAPLPLSGGRLSTRVRPPAELGLEAEEIDVDFRVVSPEYFRTMGLPLLAGRGFTSQDRAGSPPVIVVGEALADRFWPGRDPLGQRLGMSWSDHQEGHEVVGVVADMKYLSLGEDPRRHFYFPLAQQVEGPLFRRLVLHVRTASGDPLRVLPQVRHVARSVDPSLPLIAPRRLDQQLERSIGEVRVPAMLAGWFALVAVLLAVVGLYGAVAYGVRQRLPEIGVRMVLGARRAEVARDVLRQGMIRVAAGLVVGLVLAVGAAHLLRGTLYGVEAFDPLTFLLVPLGLAAVTLLALYLPARRAAGVDPASALRQE